jgi:hypothetical protein
MPPIGSQRSSTAKIDINKIPMTQLGTEESGESRERSLSIILP